MSKSFNQEGNNNRNGRAGVLARGLMVALIAFVLSGIASAQDETILKFKGGIGVIPVTGVANTGAVNLNVVRGVNPAGPWRIAELDASVQADGHIRVKGRGLLLANGNNIGTTGGASVHATLFCGPAASASAFDETGVELDADGNFVIDDFLSGNGPLSNPCETPVLLIRSGKAAGQGVWFAAGIRNLEDDAK